MEIQFIGPSSFPDTYVVQLFGIIASNQEDLVGAHVGIRRSGLAHLYAQILLELIAGHELQGSADLHDGIGLAQNGCKGAGQGALHVAHIGGWSQKMGGLDLVIVLGSLRHHHQIDSGTLGVAHILHLLLSSLCQDIINHRRNVVHADLVPAEVPEDLPVSGPVLVRLGVGVASGIAHPHIVAGVGQHIGQGSLWTHEHPIGGGTQHAVHEEGHRSVGRFTRFGGIRDAVHSQDVVVTGDHLVALHRVAIVFNALTLQNN